MARPVGLPGVRLPVPPRTATAPPFVAADVRAARVVEGRPVVTAPASPQKVIADELIGAGQVRNGWAQDILAALADHGYAVVSTIEPEEEGTS